jgi:hypothetical protein
MLPPLRNSGSRPAISSAIAIFNHRSPERRVNIGTGSRLESFLTRQHAKETGGLFISVVATATYLELWISASIARIDQ